MTYSLELEPIYSTVNKVYLVDPAWNKTNIGCLYMEIDGYYVWEPIKKTGYIPAWLLRMIADKLDELNKEWDDELAKFLSESINDIY